MKVSFLHTSKSHVNRFDRIVNKISESIEVEHYVNEDLLVFAQQRRELDRENFILEINHIRKNDSAIIICTCSTYGEFCSEFEDVHRIDQPIAEFIIANYSNIGVAYTLNSTKEISQKLIKGIAHAKRKSIQIREIDCSDCWDWFEKGDLERYEKEISRQIKQKCDNLEVILLAQASMAGAESYFVNEPYLVVSSPEFGVTKYLNTI